MSNVHTLEKPKRRHRSPHGFGVYVTDLELAEYLGLPEKDARHIIRALDENPRSGFPKKQPFFRDRRYLPAIEEWLKTYNRLQSTVPPRRSS